MKAETTHIRIPLTLKNELDAIAKSEQRDRITVVTRMLTEAISKVKS
jgi:predicted DNA-binding protein